MAGARRSEVDADAKDDAYVSRADARESEGERASRGAKGVDVSDGDARDEAPWESAGNARSRREGALDAVMRQGSTSAEMDDLEASMERSTRLSGTSSATEETTWEHRAGKWAPAASERGAANDGSRGAARQGPPSISTERGAKTRRGFNVMRADESYDHEAWLSYGGAPLPPGAPPPGTVQQAIPAPITGADPLAHAHQQYVMNVQMAAAQNGAMGMPISPEAAVSMPAIWTNDDPSRTIYLVLADPAMTDQMIWSVMSQFGDIRAVITDLRRSLNAVFVAFYDIRAAEMAKLTMQMSTHLFHMVAYSGTCEWVPGMENQGRFLAYDVGPSDEESDKELRATLDKFGEVKRLMAPRGHENHRFVEYFDVRHAQFAVMELQKNGFKGEALAVDFTWGHSQSQTSHVAFSPPSPSSVAQYMGQAAMMANVYWQYGGAIPTMPIAQSQGYGYQGWPADPAYGYPMMQGRSSYGGGRSPRSSGEFSRSPRTSESMARSRSSHNSTLDTLHRSNPEEFMFSMEEANEEGTEDHPELHGRTTLMIRNIPNKYNQAMMLDLLNRSYANQYDFFYLPIDFKNKCNLGYAFVNFKCAKTTAAFYKEFHKQRWEEFNSRKVCEVTYARVQGKDAMVDHFKNSRFPCENEEYLPLVFDTEGNKTSAHTLGQTAATRTGT